ncbi:MAG: MerR family DNA-binding protein [Proteobacteria bacterium]|nr:MerR family DNA-binding protein [Pseudomonadota bacterium]
MNKTISEFAKFCDVGVETIRYYQREGILDTPARGNAFSPGRIRRYGDKDIHRLQFILSAKKAGFTLKEIKQLLELDAKNNRERVRNMAEQRIAKLDAQITEFKKARESLYHLVKECKKASLTPCPILVAFEPK